MRQKKNMKNRVARLVEVGKIEIFEEDVPSLKDEELLVGIKAVGICGSDMHYFLEGGLGTFKQSLPMNIGHEPAGVVLEMKGKTEFRKGERVALEPGRVCLSCKWCLKGRHNLCTNALFMGANSQGAFADYIVVHKSQVFKIPEKMSYEEGALLEPIGVGMHAVNLAQPFAYQSATVFGAGPIGLSLMLVLKKFGLNEIYMVDKLDYRVEFAEKLGATRAFHYKDSVSEIKNLTDKQGTTLAFDAAGNDESIGGCVDVVAVQGKIGLVGIPTEDFVTYNPHKLRTKEVTLINVRRSNQTIEDSLILFKDDKNISKMVTHRFKLEDIQKAFDVVGKYEDNVIKSMMVRSEDF